MSQHSQDDDLEHTVMSFTSGFKYDLLKFLDSYRFSQKHLEAIEQCVEIIVARELDAYKEKQTNDKHELILAINAEAEARKLQDKEFTEMMKNTKVLFGGAMGLATIIISIIQLVVK